MAIRDNIITPEVRADGFGGVEDPALSEAIEQMASVQAFKTKPKAEDIFDASYLPPSGERRVN